MTPTPVGPAPAIDPSWSKPTPVEITSVTTSGTCGPDGDTSGDPETNHRKNRVDEPPAPHAVTFAAIATLPIPHVPTTRNTWTASDRVQITPYEGIPVTLVGYITNAVKEEGKEKTNCRFTKKTEVDWHIPLVALAHDLESNAVVVETTPRVRKNHPRWTVARLGSWIDSSNPVRISGWLMFDPDHPPHLGVYRATLWEIHSVTKIEVWKNGGWTDLESLP